MMWQRRGYVSSTVLAVLLLREVRLNTQLHVGVAVLTSEVAGFGGV
jgi:hypothetical protein